MTQQPKGLAKLWREIKRPFKQLRQGVRKFVRGLTGYYDLHTELHNELHELRNELRHELRDLHQGSSNLHNDLHIKYEALHNDLFQDLTGFIQRSISTAILHQKTFSRYKNIHQGQEIVLVATGPTAKDYKRIDGAIHIGVNRAFQFDGIDLHYLFMQDYGVKPYIKEANQYKPESCTKFYGMLDTMPEILIPESDVIEANALRYRTDFTPDGKYQYQFRYFIDSEQLGDYTSVIFPAIQFALWTNPRTIYLVGCDCTKGYFDGQASVYSASHLIPAWHQLKEFARVYYPETKILSINPVGLKGIFDERE